MKRSLRRALWLLCLIGLTGSGPVSAAEFYSWIDPSGTMVMTDDPSHIPPALARSPVSIHRFDELSGRPETARRRLPSAQAQDQPRGKLHDTPRDGVRDVSVTKANNPGKNPASAEATDHPAEPTDGQEPVLLEAPEEAAQRDYLWVPLLSPVYLGSNQVSGFWCHRSVSSPVDAFKVFLAQHGGANHQVLIAGGQLQLGNLFNRPGPSRWSRTRSSRGVAGGPGGGPTGTTVYDQVLREQRALIERATAPFQPSGGRPPQSSTGRSRGPGGHRGHVR